MHVFNKYSLLFTSTLFLKYISLVYAPLIMFTASHVAKKQALIFDWWTTYVLVLYMTAKIFTYNFWQFCSNLAVFSQLVIHILGLST